VTCARIALAAVGGRAGPVAGGLQYQLWFGAGGSGAVIALQQQVQSRTRKHRLAAAQRRLGGRSEGPQGRRGAIEERARSELGMIKPGEKFYRVVDPTASSDNGTQAPASPDDAPAPVQEQP
jgi:cell division protein FtsB